MIIVNQILGKILCNKSEKDQNKEFLISKICIEIIESHHCKSDFEQIFWKRIKKKESI